MSTFPTQGYLVLKIRGWLFQNEVALLVPLICLCGILAAARRAAYTAVNSAVNSAMVSAYWQIGRRIVEEEQGGSAKSTYGDRLLPEFPRALTAEFGKGFSLANLKNFRQFYLTYPDPQICYAVRSKLTWTHHRLIMRVESHSAREYYITHAERENWSTRTLERRVIEEKQIGGDI